MTKLLKKIHNTHSAHIKAINELEKELLPYLEDSLNGELFQIFIAPDEGFKLFLISPMDLARYELTLEHIRYIKKHKKLNNDHGWC